MPTVNLKFQVTTFEPVLATLSSPRYSSASLSSPDTGPNLPFTLTGTAPNQLLTLTKPGQYMLVFTIVDSSNQDGVYFPVGMALRPVGGGQSGTNLHATFPQVNVQTPNQPHPGGPTTLTLTANKPNVTTTYDFEFVIQQASDGALGIIDPKITNQT
jgi:hypothetical protein